MSEITARLEKLDEKGEIELDIEEGVINFAVSAGKKYVLNKHAASQQIWLSSPVSGAHRFSYEPASQKWKNSSGMELESLLMSELHGF